MKPLPCRSSCKIGSRTHIRNETLVIGFVMRMIETELNKEKQEVLIIYTHTQTQLHFRRCQQSRSNCSKFTLLLNLRQGLT